MDGQSLEQINRRIRACDYITVAQIFLKDNFCLERPLSTSDIKPRLLGHWGTCHGINVAYANLKYRFKDNKNFHFILGPGHGFPALQANLFFDGDLTKVNSRCKRDYAGLKYICEQFSWPDGFPSHASPLTPGTVAEGGELGYAVANAYGLALGHPEKTVAVLIGDGELETATTIDSLNLQNLLGGPSNGRVLPILHLNGYKISGPSIYARKPKQELSNLIRGFGFEPIYIDDNDPLQFQTVLRSRVKNPFYILKTIKGATGPNKHDKSHQVPLPNAKTDKQEFETLEKWLKSYHFEELFDKEKGFYG